MVRIQFCDSSLWVKVRFGMRRRQNWRGDDNSSQKTKGRIVMAEPDNRVPEAVGYCEVV
jgi:hypothetical protein